NEAADFAKIELLERNNVLNVSSPDKVFNDNVTVSSAPVINDDAVPPPLTKSAYFEYRAVANQSLFLFPALDVMQKNLQQLMEFQQQYAATMMSVWSNVLQTILCHPE